MADRHGLGCRERQRPGCPERLGFNGEGDLDLGVVHFILMHEFLHYLGTLLLLNYIRYVIYCEDDIGYANCHESLDLMENHGFVCKFNQRFRLG
jgi:hypothetical protein